MERKELPKELKAAYEHPAVLGKTKRRGRNAGTSLYHFQGINVIVGIKGTGKSHVAKTILLALLDEGAKCVVFDINDEYSGLARLPEGGESPLPQQDTTRCTR